MRRWSVSTGRLPATARAAPGALSAALVAALAACGEDAPPPKPAPVAAEKYTKFVPAEAGGAQPPKVEFVDATAGSGVDFTHVNGAFGRKYLPETMGAGVAILDYDGDGLLDLFLVQGREWPGHETLAPAPTCRLYRNAGGGLRFEDVTAQVGLDVTLLGMGACAADYDGDGDADLFVTELGPGRLFRNDARTGDDGRIVRRFVDVAGPAGVQAPGWTDREGRSHPSWTTGAAWLDYDVDGVLDLFVCHYVHWSIENDVFDTLNGTTKAYTIPTKYDADSCRLYRGRGDGTFEDVTRAAGIERADSKALGCAVADVNGDGRPDIAVANDTQPNYLFLSQPDGRFLEQANEAGIAFDEVGRARAGMGIDVGEPRDDGRLVVTIGNFSREPVSMFTQAGDRVFFVDRAGAARIATPTSLSLTFGVLFCDFDLDGAQDLLCCNGHIEPEIQQVQKDVSYEQPTQLFWNRGDGMFADVSREVGEVLSRRIVGRGVAAGDLDQDGDLDFVITQNGRPALLARNDQRLGHGWVRVRLQGSGGNRDALGATITLESGGTKRRREVRTGSSYLSQCDVAPTFGLGRSTGPVDVEVRWPGGRRERFDGLAPGREHRLVEGAGR